jgi:hypothetical protein
MEFWEGQNFFSVQLQPRMEEEWLGKNTRKLRAVGSLLYVENGGDYTVYKFVKTYQNIQLQWVSFMAYRLYLNKVEKKKTKNYGAWHLNALWLLLSCLPTLLLGRWLLFHFHTYWPPADSVWIHLHSCFWTSINIFWDSCPPPVVGKTSFQLLRCFLRSEMLLDHTTKANL